MSAIKKIVIALGIATAFSLASVPLATTFADTTTSDAVVKVNVPAELSMTVTTSGTDPSAATSVEPGASNSSKGNTITVSGNSNYKVAVKDSDTSNALTSSAGNTIAAFTSAQTSLSNPGWGMTTTAAYATNHTGSFTAGTYLGVPVSTSDALTVVQTSNTTAGFTNDSTTVQYGIKVPTTQVSGTYSDTIVYTLSAV